MGRAMCFVSPDGERTFGISKGCMNDLAPEFIPAEVIEKASALLISAYILRDEKDPIFSATIKACETALKAKVPNSPKNLINSLSYSSLSQISKYANRVSFEVLAQNSPRLMRALPEKEDSLQEAYWDA